MTLVERAKQLLQRLPWKRTERQILALSRAHFDMTLHHRARQWSDASRNPLNGFGRKCFSQSDEDGITLEILRRIDCLADGTFAEFGVGDGMENNTLVLAALGWKGLWVGGETLRPRLERSAHPKLIYLRDWITRDNIVALARKGLARIGRPDIDLISLDLDGNDIHLVEALLSDGLKPKLFIVEYNAKFLPPVRFSIAYDASHRWQGDDYFGASLTSFVDLFERFGYRLVCCNSQTGSNAFFVDRKYQQQFDDIPFDIALLYCEPRYWLYQKYGHRGSVRTVEAVINHRGVDDAPDAGSVTQ